MYELVCDEGQRKICHECKQFFYDKEFYITYHYEWPICVICYEEICARKSEQDDT